MCLALGSNNYSLSPSHSIAKLYLAIVFQSSFSASKLLHLWNRPYEKSGRGPRASAHIETQTVTAERSHFLISISKSRSGFPLRFTSASHKLLLFHLSTSVY